jgi:hypothetical protein
MHPIVISPLIKIAIGVISAGAAMVLAAREMRRISNELERMKAAPNLDAATRKSLPTLRRDPRTGEWRID